MLLIVVLLAEVTLLLSNLRLDLLMCTMTPIDGAISNAFYFFLSAELVDVIKIIIRYFLLRCRMDGIIIL
jgi:hypothetical protein